jgi:pyridoxamine 5'-phosphate oxidase
MSGSLSDMRRAYAEGGLAEEDLAATWPAQFAVWLADAVRAGIAEPNAMVLATASADGAPSARTVLLKGFDERGFVLYTNLGSRKGRDTAANPRASLVFPWIGLQRQVLVTGAVERVGAAESDAYFASRPRGAQLGALASPQGATIAAREELLAAMAELERRHPEGTAVPRPEHWGGLRVVPATVEFWQGRPNRLHDRLSFGLQGDGMWTVQRLAP